MKPLEFTTVKPLEFTTVSVEEARRALEGEPTKPGASQLTFKRTQTPKEPLLDVTRTWLASCSSTVAAPAKDSRRKSLRSWRRYANTMRCCTRTVALHGTTWKRKSDARPGSF